MNRGYFFGDVPKQRIFTTPFSRSSWSVVLQRNLMFAASFGVIVRSDSLSKKSWDNVL